MTNEIEEVKCKFCKPKNPKTLVGGRSSYTSAWVKIYTNDNDVRIGLNATGDSDVSISVEINYCPMCGRNFKDKCKMKD